jgi:MOSC domain-containing protein YiiM
MAEWTGKVAFIQISPTAGERMVPVREVRAVAGEGLEGDRYFKKGGTYSKLPGTGRQITLIELESVEALKRDYQINLDPAQTRRNIVTQGVPLNHLVGKQFRMGREVVVQGMRLCEPCEYLESLTLKGVMSGLSHRGGLRADIVNGGILKVGDEVTPI